MRACSGNFLGKFRSRPYNVYLVSMRHLNTGKSRSTLLIKSNKEGQRENRADSEVTILLPILFLTRIWRLEGEDVQVDIEDGRRLLLGTTLTLHTQDMQGQRIHWNPAKSVLIRNSILTLMWALNCSWSIQPNRHYRTFRLLPLQ